MTEKEKMLSGQYFDSRDPELVSLYHRAKRLLKAYNALDSDKSEERRNIPAELFDLVGEGVWIEAPFYCDFGENISIGAGTFVNTNCVLTDNNKITIGSNGLIAPNVQIFTATHPGKACERIISEGIRSYYLTSSQPVTIGDNVWIGGNAVVLPGVTIGNNVTIGAGSVVTRNIPDNALAFGNPCVVQRVLE